MYIFLESAGSLVTIVVFVWAVVRWISKVDLNTQATEELSGTFKDFSKDMKETLLNHERRITVLEVKKSE